jgi:hypothetical protein
MGAQNQATDYLRYQQEIAKQKAELEARRKKENSFGNRMLRVGGALLPVAGMAAGAAFGGPVGGMIGGGLGSALGQAIGPPGMSNNAASMAMAGGMAGSYLRGSPAAATAGANPYNEAEGLMQSGQISPAQYKDFLEQQRLYQSGGLAGPGF